MQNEKKELLEELKKITKLLMLLVITEKNQNDQIELLSNADFQPKEIADFLNTSPNTVRVTLDRIKKKSLKKNIK